MRREPGYPRELVALVLLFALFLFGAFRLELLAQRLEPQDQPSTLANTRPGAGAIYQLVEALGYSDQRLTKPWTQLNGGVGSLVVLEPLSRPPDEAEIGPLQEWVRGGGTLFCVRDSMQLVRDPFDDIMKGVTVELAPSGETHAAPADPASPYSRGVKSIAVSSPIRFSLVDPHGFHVLFMDSEGIVAVSRNVGKGRVILMADDLIASNLGVAQDDNAVFITNLVAASAGPNRNLSIAFDEYHHGVGFDTPVSAETAGLMDLMPGPLKWTLADLLVFGLVLLYMGNLRIGPIIRPRETVQKISRDYVNSMSRLYRRADSKDLAVQAIYQRFLRDLKWRMNLRPDVPPARVAEAFTETSAAGGSALVRLINRCEQAVAGLAVSDMELVELVTSIAQFRRDFDIVEH